jgi:hypothetical protein
MKKFGTILLAALLVASYASPGLAQMTAGVKGGIDFANLGGDVTDTDSKLGFSAGAFLGIDLHEYFRLQFEGQFVQKGMQFTEEGVDVKFKLNYVELLVPATLTIPMENSAITPRLYAGPSVAFELSCKATGEEGGESESFDCADVPPPDGPFDTKSVDFGVFFGGGVDIAVGSGAVTLDVLYNLGLANINDTEGETDFEIKNKNIQILVGYAFGLGG